ncbi:MAG: RNA methyltransferase [Mucilaginibacter polytrichastri]|nr:RNA methyltransferase [Mucilaginibacter polytrichastri]
MLSKSQISFIRSLHQKKYRKEQGLFLVEGLKSITEFFASSYVIDALYLTDPAAAKVLKIPHKINVTEIGTADLQRISALQTPQDALAVLRIPEKLPVKKASLKNSFTLVLDGVQDPGNLGTIIRTADWFGFSRIICSNDTVEAWNPKTVQATMGSLARITIDYTELPELLEGADLPVYGTLLDGDSIFETNWTNEGLIVLGSEGRGISEAVKPHISRAITIPRFGAAESLNVAVAAAICCTEIRRTQKK